ncbi:MAG: hypothetical protein IKE91_06480 [Clostridia bacterium]|nr:hypothetical protein [Clostridia bacterium]
MGEIRGTMDDAINRLVTFCTKYPKIWRSRATVQFIIKDIIPDENERALVLEELEQAKKDIVYINRRNSLGKVSEEQMQVLKDAGVIWNHDEVDKIVAQYEIALRSGKEERSQEDIKRETNRLRTILREKEAQFGSIDVFREVVIDAIATNNSEELTEAVLYGGIDYLITKFDISQEDYITDKNYTKLMFALGYKDQLRTVILDSKFVIDNVLNYACSKMEDGERAQSIMVMRYGLDGNKPQRVEDIAADKNISVARVRQIEDKNILRMRTSRAEKYISSSMLEGEAREAFIRKYFEHHDIFTFSSSEGLTEEVREALKKIYEEGTRDNRDDLALREEGVESINSGNPSSYVFDKDTILKELDILSLRALNTLARNEVSTVGKLLQLTKEDINRIRLIGRAYSDEIIAVKRLLERFSLKPGKSDIELTDDIFEVLNFPSNTEEIIAEHVKPSYKDEGIPFSVADFIMMSDDEISEMSGGTKKLNQIRLIRDKLRGHFRDLDVDKIEESSHEKLVQIILMKQQTIADQEEEIDALMKQQDTQTRD